MSEIDEIRKELGQVRVKLETHLATCEERRKHMAEELRELTDTVKTLTTAVGHLHEIEQRSKGSWWLAGVAAMALLQMTTLVLMAIQTLK